MTNPDKPKIFISYSHKNDAEMERMRTHLKPMVINNWGDVWTDKEIKPGAEWDDEIKTKLAEADIIIFLCSADLINSDYVMRIEAARAEERYLAGEAIIIPVILHSCGWKHTLFGKLKAVPKDGLPIDKWPNEDGYYEAAERIIELVKERIAARESGGSGAAGRAVALGEHNLPKARNNNFTGRRSQLRELEDAGAGGGHIVIRTISGLGGIGKTELAREFAWRRVEDGFPVWWVRADNNSSLVDDLADLAAHLGIKHGQPEDKARAAIARLEKEPQWLLIFDNAETPDVLEGWLPKTGCLTLITSRYTEWDSQSIRPISLGLWQRPTAIGYIREMTGAADEQAAGRLADLLGNLPLAIDQAVAYINRQKISADDYIEQFKSYYGDLLAGEGLPLDSAERHERTVAIIWEATLPTSAQ